MVNPCSFGQSCPKPWVIPIDLVNPYVVDRYASYWSLVDIDTSWLRRQRSGWHLTAITGSRKRITSNPAVKWPLHGWLRRWCPRGRGHHLATPVLYPSGIPRDRTYLRTPWLHRPYTVYTYRTPPCRTPVIHAQASRTGTRPSDNGHMRTSVRHTCCTSTRMYTCGTVTDRTPKKPHSYRPYPTAVLPVVQCRTLTITDHSVHIGTTPLGLTGVITGWEPVR